MSEAKEGLFYRRGDGTVVPLLGATYVIVLDANGKPCSLQLFVEGRIDESYNTAPETLPLFLAAISQGFEPPRGLMHRGKLAR
jgi:hypothetical protein